ALHETLTIVVGARKRPVGLDHDTTDRAYASRDSVDFIHTFHRLLLVRQRQIATGKSKRMQRAEGGLETRRRDRERDIRSSQMMLLKPVVVQHRRAGMHDGPPHDTRQQETVGTGHGRIFSRMVWETCNKIRPNMSTDVTTPVAVIERRAEFSLGANLRRILCIAVPLLVWFSPLPLEATTKHGLAVTSFMIIAWITEALDHALAGLIGCYLRSEEHTSELQSLRH